MDNELGTFRQGASDGGAQSRKLTGKYRQDCAQGRFRIDEQDADYQGMFSQVTAWGLTNPDTGMRLDAGETATITRQLLYIKARTFDVKYPMFKARDFIPVSHEVPSGAETWAYWQWDMYGMAKIVANYATDFPRADVVKKEFQMPIKSLGDSYAYTIQDMRRIAFMAPQGGGQLDVKRAAAARRAIEAAIDDIAAVGLPNAGFSGFVNNANVPLMALPTGNWAVASALQMIGDLNAVTQRVITQTNQVEVPDTMLFPTAAFQIMTQTPFSTLSSYTVATWFLDNNPYIGELDQWIKLDKANAGGTGGRIICYRRDEEVVTLEIPQEFEQFQPQLEGMEYSIPCHARIGGVAFYYPLAAVRADGVN